MPVPRLRAIKTLGITPTRASAHLCRCGVPAASVPRRCPPAFLRCRCLTRGHGHPKASHLGLSGGCHPTWHLQPPATASLWLPGPGKAVSREVSACLKTCCLWLAMSSLMQDLPTLSPVPKAAWPPAAWVLQMPSGHLGVARDAKKWRKGKKMHLGLHFNPCKSSTCCLCRRAQPNLRGCCGVGARGNGGRGTLHPSVRYPLAASCSPSLRQPQLPSTA